MLRRSQSRPPTSHLATVRAHDIVCFAHVTNRMAAHGVDFEKGAEDGAAEALQIMAAGATLLGR